MEFTQQAGLMMGVRYKISRYRPLSGRTTLSVICICVFVFVAAHNAYPQYALDFWDLRQKARVEIGHENYLDAEITIDSLLVDPEMKGWGHLYKATLRLTQQVDFGDTLFSGQFFENLRLAESHFTKKLNNNYSLNNAEAADLHFGLATLYSLEAQFYNEVVGKPLKAYPFLKDARKNFERTLSFQPTHDDARIALAVFNFWQSHVLRYINWLPVLQDDRPESLELLKKHILESKRLDISVAVSLMWILIEDGKPEESLEVAEKYYRVYGPLRSILEPAGKACYLIGDYEKSSSFYEVLISSLENQDRLNKTRIIGALNRLATMANLQKDYSSVVFYADAALSFDLNEAEAKKKAKDLVRLAGFKRSALKAMDR